MQYQPVKTSSTQRRAAFISPATQSVSLAVTVANGTPVTNPVPTTINVGPTSTSCTATGALVTCTASLNAPVGSDVISVASFKGANGTGTQLGTTLAPITITQNSANRFPLDIGGNVMSLELYLSKSTLSVTSPTALVVIVPLDASGAVIVNPGNYNPSIAVASSDTTGAFSLLLNGTASGTSATVASPNDQVVLSYSGNGSTPVSTTVTATAGTATASANAHAGSGPPALVGSGSGTGYTPASPEQFIFTGPGQTGTLTVSGGVPPYTISSANASIAAVAGTSPTFSVTSGSVGSTTLTVTDSASAHFTYSATVTAPPIAIAVNSCGTSATCTTGKITFPQYTSSGVTPQETGTIGLTGGTGTYAYYFESSGTTTSQYAAVTQSGNALTITPSGAGNDALIISSGGQYAFYGIATPTSSPLAALLPAAMGMVIMQNTGGVAKSYSLPLPSAVTSYTQTSGMTDNNFVGPPGQPGLFTATPMTPGIGAVQFADNAGNAASVPFTIFGLTFANDAGTGITSNVDNPTPADEQFLSTGSTATDTVTVAGAGGAIVATSSNTNVVTIGSQTATTFQVTPVNAGTATVSVEDSSNSAAITYTVSVTTATIPIASHRRSP